jgi:SpoVK/Ycf46/Vps4 family AAA+-type ATPase
MSEEVSSLLEGASLAQSVGDLDTALAQYQQALEILIAKLKLETKGSEKHEQLFQTVNVYLNEAESIKLRIASSKAAPANSSSSSLPSISPMPTTSTSIAVTKKTSATSPKLNPSSAKPALPDNYDYSLPRKPKTSKPTSSSDRKSTSPKRTTASSPMSSRRSVSPVPADGKVKLKPAEDKLNEYEKQIMDEMMETSPSIRWDDIAGLAFAKQTLQEAVILPNMRPDLFVGLRAPPRGVLLFGPPGKADDILDLLPIRDIMEVI